MVVSIPESGAATQIWDLGYGILANAQRPSFASYKSLNSTRRFLLKLPIRREMCDPWTEGALMARRKDDEEEYEDEYEEEYEGGSVVDRFSSASWRRIVLIPLILILFGFGAWTIWKKYRDKVLAHPSYALDPQNIKYTDPPAWITGDILEDVVKLGSLEEKRIHDTGLTVQVASAFEHHPCVKRVERVRIAYPAKLSVELTYRTPIAMVALPDDDPNDGEAWILPIDAEGVLLRSEDFTPEFAQSFPRIDVGNTEPSGPPGSGWGDEAVADAAKIAEVLYEDWDTLKDVIYQVELSAQSSSMSMNGDFDVRGRPDLGPRPPGLLIHWGRAPGHEQAGEPTAKAKLAKLKQWVNDARMTGRLPIGEIDLRSVKALQSAKSQARATEYRR